MKKIWNFFAFKIFLSNFNCSKSCARPPSNKALALFTTFLEQYSCKFQHICTQIPVNSAKNSQFTRFSLLLTVPRARTRTRWSQNISYRHVDLDWPINGSRAISIKKRFWWNECFWFDTRPISNRTKKTAASHEESHIESGIKKINQNNIEQGCKATSTLCTSNENTIQHKTTSNLLLVA